MVKMINRSFGCEMWVDESRVNEYLEAGHRLASAPTAKAADMEKQKRTKKEPVKK